MSKSMFREIHDNEDVTDIIVKCFVFLSIPAVMFVAAVAIWTFF